MRKVSEVLASPSQRAELGELVTLLRETLSRDELQKLCQRLAS